MSGTTRDAVDTDVTLPGGEKVKLIDTAGIRKRAKVRSLTVYHPLHDLP